MHKCYLKKVHKLSLAVCILVGLSQPLQAESLSPSTYKKLNDIQTLMSENKLTEALSQIKKLEGNVAEDSLSKAIVLQTWGYLEMSNNRYSQAAEKFRQSLAVGKLPEKAALNVRFMMAQLYAGEGQFEKALNEANVWYAALSEFKASDHIFMANIYAQLKQYANAQEYAYKAIELVEEPKEAWFQLVLAAQFEQKHYQQAAKTLGILIQHWPDKKTYWEQAASVQMLLENELDALAILQLAWKQKMLDKQASIISMVQLANANQMPEPAARLLTKALNEEFIERNEKHLKMLAGAWEQAREKSKAAQAYGDLASVTQKGDDLLKQAQLLIDLEQWTEAEAVLKRALDLGLKKTDKAWLLLGVTQVQDGRFDSAKKTLEKARAFKSVASQANAWIAYARQKHEYQKWKKAQS
ncbi:tetratricopeptide repeat protein [Gayadomonas joobiniege]|uniref:tetratricopeptide repeat protein n=1 Tax=Gayadomonas joobiniege TaxID=1234606 RepID=UPI000369EBD4|nr:tetratricopeptide repeat protein [Gayadomonas joobiniege]